VPLIDITLPGWATVLLAGERESVLAIGLDHPHNGSQLTPQCLHLLFQRSDPAVVLGLSRCAIDGPKKLPGPFG
jgi:hypothetical protein